jgi:hypothetical protein
MAKGKIGYPAETGGPVIDRSSGCGDPVPTAGVLRPDPVVDDGGNVGFGCGVLCWLDVPNCECKRDGMTGL